MDYEKQEASTKGRKLRLIVALILQDLSPLINPRTLFFFFLSL
jgi:hypothetical protein